MAKRCDEPPRQVPAAFPRLSWDMRPPLVAFSRLTKGTPGIRVAGTLECGGVLTVINDPAQAVRAGSTFRLFDATDFAGSFASLNLPAGVQWDTSKLLVDGTITAVRVEMVAPLILPVAVADGTVVIRFASTAGLHYVVEVTDSLFPPVRWTAYVALIGTGGIMPITLPVPPATADRFFRVRMY